MKDILLEELNRVGPKSIGVRARTLGLVDQLINETNYLTEDCTITQRIWHILNDEGQSFCSCGNNRKFIGFGDGYKIGCTPECPDIAISRRQKCLDFRTTITEQQKSNIESKRLKTVSDMSEEEYNTYQTNRKEGHAKVYADPKRVAAINLGIKSTSLENWGSRHPMKTKEGKDRVKDAIQRNYGVDNAWQIPANRIKREISRKENQQQEIDRTNKTRHHNYYLKYVELLKIEGYKLLCSEEEFGGIWEQTYNFKHVCGETFKYICHGGERNFPTCRKCFPINTFRSRQEQEVFEFIKGFCPTAYKSDRKIIGPQELDIVIPKLNLAIEYCGMIWHSERFGKKEKNYHYNKMQRCKEAGYRLITIFDDEWLKKKDIVKMRIMNMLGMNTSSFGARNCSIQLVDKIQAKEFTDLHHLQGHTPAQIYYGAFYKDALVSVMSFGKNRKITGSKEQSWEIVRFCSNQTIPGVANKLFKRFIEENKPNKVISYCDLRWNTGLVYEKLGMRLINNPKPSYWYLDSKYSERKHRSNFTKKHLVEQLKQDANLTEFEIMDLLGYDKIWDCGQARFEIDF